RGCTGGDPVGLLAHRPRDLVGLHDLADALEVRLESDLHGSPPDLAQRHRGVVQAARRAPEQLGPAVDLAADDPLRGRGVLHGVHAVDVEEAAHVQPEMREHLVALLGLGFRTDRKSTRLNSSHVKISYAVFCLKKKKYKEEWPQEKPMTSTT